MTISEIPLQAGAPQRLSITLSNVTYTLTFVFNNVLGTWIMDIADDTGTAVVSGVALVTGTDLLGQVRHLGFVGELRVQGDANAAELPTFDNLGAESHLYYVTP